MEFKEHEGSITVPKNTGIEGFVRTLREILKKPYIQSISIDVRGIVKYRHYVREAALDDAQNFGVDFEDLQPWYVIRNATVEEVALEPSWPAPMVVGLLFDHVSQRQLHPIAFATGANSILWDWYSDSTGHVLRTGGPFFGLPLLTDRNIPDTALILSAGLVANAAFIDTQVSFKVEMQLFDYPDTNIEVGP